MMRQRDILFDNLRTSNYLGQVEDINDPRKEGRIKVRVFGKFDLLDLEALPWAEPSNCITGGSSTGSGFFSLPKIGSIVEVYFDNGNIYQPIYKQNLKVSNELKDSVSDEDYTSLQSVLYDTDATNGLLQIKYVDSEGLTIGVENSVFNIRQDKSVSITSNSGKTLHILEDKISIGSENESDEPAVLGLQNEIVLNDTLNKIDSILSKLIKFTNTQISICSGAYILSPLVPSLSGLLTDLNVEKSSIINIKNKVEKTKSKTISLDK